MIQVNVDDDVLKLSVVERYGKNGQVGSAFVRGFKLKSGALASSVSHDHHNIVIVGTNDQDMYLAARELEKCQGGFAAVENGVVKGILPLPIGGLMSCDPAKKVMKEIDALNRVVRGHGVRPPGTVHEPLVCVPAHGTGTGFDRPGADQCEGPSKNTGGGWLVVVKS